VRTNLSLSLSLSLSRNFLKVEVVGFPCDAFLSSILVIALIIDSTLSSQPLSRRRPSCSCHIGHASVAFGDVTHFSCVELRSSQTQHRTVRCACQMTDEICDNYCWMQYAIHGVQKTDRASATCYRTTKNHVYRPSPRPSFLQRDACPSFSGCPSPPDILLIY